MSEVVLQQEAMKRVVAWRWMGDLATTSELDMQSVYRQMLTKRWSERIGDILRQVPVMYGAQPFEDTPEYESLLPEEAGNRAVWRAMVCCLGDPALDAMRAEAQESYAVASGNLEEAVGVLGVDLATLRRHVPALSFPTAEELWTPPAGWATEPPCA